jgi:hypothetical protein
MAVIMKLVMISGSLKEAIVGEKASTRTVAHTLKSYSAYF